MDDKVDVKENFISEEGSLFYSLLIEIVSSPINMFLLSICLFLLYKLCRSSNGKGSQPSEPPLPKMKHQDMTLEQLLQYDGTGAHGRVCVAVNGKIFDVTRGRNFYGPGGPYSAFAGHDATRALATFSIKDVKNEQDDLSDLSSSQMDSVREWETQFEEKYDFIGKLLKIGDQPTEYSDDEENLKETPTKKED